MNMIREDEIKKMASFYPLRLDFQSKENIGGLDDKQQAEYLLQLVNFLCLNGYEKVGLAVSTNYQQTKGKKIYGRGQASVVNLMNELLDKDKNYSHLKGKIKFLPITTCEFGGNKRGELKMEWVVDDINDVNDFKRQEGNIVIGWKNQKSMDEYAYGGGVAGNLPPDIHNAIQTAFKGFEKEYKEKKSSQISIPCPLALKYCNLFQVYALSCDKAPDPNRLDDPWQYGKQLAERLSKCIFISPIEDIEDDDIEGVLTIQSVLTSYLCRHVREHFSNTGSKLIKLVDGLQKEAVLEDWHKIEEEKNPQGEDDWILVKSPQEEINRHFEKGRTMFFGSPKILYGEGNKQECISDCINGLKQLKVAGKDKNIQKNLIVYLEKRDDSRSYKEIYYHIMYELESVKSNNGFPMNKNLKTFLKNFLNNMKKPDIELTEKERKYKEVKCMKYPEKPTEGNGKDRKIKEGKEKEEIEILTDPTLPPAERIRFFKKMLSNPHFIELMTTKNDRVKSLRNVALNTLDILINDPTNYSEEDVRDHIEKNKMLFSNPIYFQGYFKAPSDQTSGVNKILEEFNTHCQNTPKKTL